MKTVKTAKNRSELSGRPPPRFGSAGSGGKRRIYGVDLTEHEHRSIGSANSRNSMLTSIDRYTGPSPTVSRIFLIIPSVPTR